MNNLKNIINTMKNKNQTAVSPLRRTVPALLALAMLLSAALAWQFIRKRKKPAIA